MLKTLSIKAESYVKIYIFRVWQWTHLARPRWQHSLWRLQGPRDEYEDNVQNMLLLLHNNRKNVYWCLGGKEWHMLGKEHWGLSAQFWGLHLWCNLWMWRRSRFCHLGCVNANRWSFFEDQFYLINKSNQDFDRRIDGSMNSLTHQMNMKW